MEQVFQTIASPRFQSIMFDLSIVTFVLCLGAVAVALVFYRRGREVSKDAADERWVLLIATWRDSLIITMLYVAEGLAYSQSGLLGISQIIPNSVLFYSPVMQPVISLILQVLIFVICAIRIVALTRWLSVKATNT